MTTCAICLSDVCDEDHGNNAYSFECNHTFHATCLVGWLRQGNLSCPTCRADVYDPAERIDAMTLRARAKYLRSTVARRKSCPADLKRLVASVRIAEEAERQTARDLVALRRDHGDVLKTFHRLRARRWASSRRTREKVRALGAYASRDVPLPPLLVNHYQI